MSLQPHRVVLLMGVSAAGKTTVGLRLAERLGWSFHDGDDFHPPSNVDRMAAGTALTDEDRQPWLERIRQLIRQHRDAGPSAVVACSALKESYRTYLWADSGGVLLVYLRAPRELLAKRLEERRGHFFDAQLLASQLDTLEEPSQAVTIDVDTSVDSIVDSILAALGLEEP